METEEEEEGEKEKNEEEDVRKSRTIRMRGERSPWWATNEKMETKGEEEEEKEENEEPYEFEKGDDEEE